MASATQQISHSNRALRMRDVNHLTGLSPATVWRKVKNDPGFPRPYKLSRGVTAWDEGEVIAWLESKKAQRAAAA
jgi:predicted DNA-binding transcriptional regulator AlpA